MTTGRSGRMAAVSRRGKPIRVGVIGVGRGTRFAAVATELVGMKLVARRKTTCSS